MSLEASKTGNLLKLFRKMANISHNNKSDDSTKNNLHIHNSRTGNWDDIWLFFGSDVEQKQPLIKIALIGLSVEERSCLDLVLHKEKGYMGRSEYMHTTHHETALFKFVHKSVEKNLKSIKVLK